MTADSRNLPPLPPIRFAEFAARLLEDCESLVTKWLPGGTRRGHEYVCASLSGGAGNSTSVNLQTGRWADFATDERGNDLVSLYGRIHGLTNAHAAVQLARELGLEDVAGVLRDSGQQPRPVQPRLPGPVAAPVPKPRIEEGWRTVAPVPPSAPAPTFWHHYRNNDQRQDPIDHLAEYRIDGDLYFWVARFLTSDGGKETLPYTWCQSMRDGTQKWHWRAFDGERPLYFPGGASPLALASADGVLPTAVVVEGEKKAAVLHEVLERHASGVYVVVTWSGGCKAWPKSRWDWLKGCNVLLWPDADAHRERLTKSETEAYADDAARDIAKALKPLLPADQQPGMRAMVGIGVHLRDQHGCKVAMLPIPEPGVAPNGWDCADAINTDGWTGADVLAFFGKAQALVANVASAPAPARADLRIALDAPEPEERLPRWLAPYFDADKGRWHTSRKLVITALRNDPELVGVLAYNELSNTIITQRPWPWPFSTKGDVTSKCEVQLGDYLTQKYGLPSIPRAALQEAIQTVAYGCHVHPVRDYLVSLQWDGKSRIDKWLIHAIGETPDTLNAAMREYLALVGRFWLLGMVNRVMEPGCKFDYCPVLEGKGGLRKSTLVEVLAGSDFFSDTPFDVSHGKEAQEQVQGIWLYEIAELSNFSRAEVGAIKAFVSSKVDRYRVAYGSTVEKFPRQCVMVGTTNESAYLRDRSGNRRFLPVPVRHIINTEWVRKWRDQLFAEAYALYQAGAAFCPSQDQERRLFSPMQESRLQETAVTSELLHLLTRDPDATGSAAVVNNLADFVTISQLTTALGSDASKSGPALESQIRSWLDHQGWVRVKKMINGNRAWGYQRPAGWPNTDMGEEMQAQAGSASPVPESMQEGDDVPF